MKPQTQWSRRNFITTVAGASAAIIFSPLASWALDDIDPKVSKIVAGTMGIDTHNHVDVPLIAAEVPSPKIDLAGEMRKSGLAAICMTFAVDYQELRNPGDAYERFKNGLTSMDQQLALNGMTRALDMKDLIASHKNRKPTVIQSVEGSHFLEGHLDRLEEAYGRGLRHLTLLHDHDASVPLGDVFTNPPQWGGLTKFGAEVIKECNRLGIVVDLSHASAETVAMALKVTNQPVLISHTGLDTQLGQNQRMAQMMRPRLISKEQAKIIANTGGVIGVWTHLADSPLEYAQNVRALVDIVGIDHVCIGTDTKMTHAYRSPNFNPKPNEGAPKPSDHSDNNRDTGRTHQMPSDDHKGRVEHGTNETWGDKKSGFYYAVVDAMLKTGFSADEIGKFGGGNFCRVFDAATMGHR
jgi:microsomal dipeptidase-like Zn-dependent dipeptidase